MILLPALPLLGIARLLPEHGFGLWLRLAAATLVLLLPGRLVARALGRRGPAAALRLVGRPRRGSRSRSRSPCTAR